MTGVKFKTLLTQIKSSAAVSLVWKLTTDAFPPWQVQVYTCSFAEWEWWMVLNFGVTDRQLLDWNNKVLLVLTPLVLFTDVVYSTSSLSVPSGLETQVTELNSFSYYYTNKTQNLSWHLIKNNVILGTELFYLPSRSGGQLSS